VGIDAKQLSDGSFLGGTVGAGDVAL